MATINKCKDCWNAVVGPAQICRCIEGHWKNRLWQNMSRVTARDCPRWDENTEGDELNAETIRAIHKVELECVGGRNIL